MGLQQRQELAAVQSGKVVALGWTKKDRRARVDIGAASGSDFAPNIVGRVILAKLKKAGYLLGEEW